MKSLKFEESQTATQRHKVSGCCWKKMTPKDLLKAGLPQTFKLLQGRKQAKKAPPNSITAKPDKVKCNKRKYACVGVFDSQ